MDLLEVVAVKRQLEQEFASFTMVPKSESTFMKAVGKFLYLLTFGRQNTFMTDFTTTIGFTIYTPSGWMGWSPTTQAVILRHERVHMRQQRKYSRVLFGLLYLFIFFPLGLAWYRAKFEMEAYEESLRANHEYGMDITGPALKANIVGQFTSGNYAWMWPFRGYVEHWYDDAVKKVLASAAPTVGQSVSN